MEDRQAQFLGKIFPPRGKQVGLARVVKHLEFGAVYIMLAQECSDRIDELGSDVLLLLVGQLRVDPSFLWCRFVFERPERAFPLFDLFVRDLGEQGLGFTDLVARLDFEREALEYFGGGDVQLEQELGGKGREVRLQQAGQNERQVRPESEYRLASGDVRLDQYPRLLLLQVLVAQPRY